LELLCKNTLTVTEKMDLGFQNDILDLIMTLENYFTKEIVKMTELIEHGVNDKDIEQEVVNAWISKMLNLGIYLKRIEAILQQFNQTD